LADEHSILYKPSDVFRSVKSPNTKPERKCECVEDSKVKSLAYILIFDW